MKGVILLLLGSMLFSCSKDYDDAGAVYSGNTNLGGRVREFVATNESTEKNIVLRMTGPHELTMTYDSQVSHIDYEETVIIIKSETDQSEWSAKKVRGGFELADGTRLKYGNCEDWILCLLDDTGNPILKGNYVLRGATTEIMLWISDKEKHVELLALMTNGLFNMSRHEKESVDSSLGTLSPQVWTY